MPGNLFSQSSSPMGRPASPTTLCIFFWEIASTGDSGEKPEKLGRWPTAPSSLRRSTGAVQCTLISDPMIGTSIASITGRPGLREYPESLGMGLLAFLLHHPASSRLLPRPGRVGGDSARRRTDTHAAALGWLSRRGIRETSRHSGMMPMCSPPLAGLAPWSVRRQSDDLNKPPRPSSLQSPGLLLSLISPRCPGRARAGAMTTKYQACCCARPAPAATCWPTLRRLELSSQQVLRLTAAPIQNVPGYSLLPGRRNGHWQACCSNAASLSRFQACCCARPAHMAQTEWHM
jgi:hypothetical protein